MFFFLIFVCVNTTHTPTVQIIILIYFENCMPFVIRNTFLKKTNLFGELWFLVNFCFRVLGGIFWHFSFNALRAKNSCHIFRWRRINITSLKMIYYKWNFNKIKFRCIENINDYEYFAIFSNKKGGKLTSLSYIGKIIEIFSKSRKHNNNKKKWNIIHVCELLQP